MLHYVETYKMFEYRTSVKDYIRRWAKFQVKSSSINTCTTAKFQIFFRWKKCESLEEPETWIGVMANCLWMLKQTDDRLMYKVLGELPYPNESKYDIVRVKINEPKKAAKKGLLYVDSYYENILKSYFRLEVDLKKCYDDWSDAHTHFKSKRNQFYAVRVLNQEPVENLFSFICSQNNNISR